MIKVTIKLEDFMDGSGESHFETKTVSHVVNDRIDGVLDVVRCTLIGHTFPEQLVNSYINWDENTCTVLKIVE